MCCWIIFSRILLRIFASMLINNIGLWFYLLHVFFFPGLIPGWLWPCRMSLEAPGILLDCGVCPCGWGWINVLYYFPGWGSLCFCSGWWSWILSLSRAAQSPSSRFWGVSAFSMSLCSPSGFGNVRHIYFHSIVKVALSAYLHCHQPPTCSWNLFWYFCCLCATLHCKLKLAK